MAIAGTLMQIDKGFIRPEESVLIAITGGSRPNRTHQIKANLIVEGELDDFALSKVCSEIERYFRNKKSVEMRSRL